VIFVSLGAGLALMGTRANPSWPWWAFGMILGALAAVLLFASPPPC